MDKNVDPRHQDTLEMLDDVQFSAHLFSSCVQMALANRSARGPPANDRCRGAVTQASWAAGQTCAGTAGLRRLWLRCMPKSPMTTGTGAPASVPARCRATPPLTSWKVRARISASNFSWQAISANKSMVLKCFPSTVEVLLKANSSGQQQAQNLRGTWRLWLVRLAGRRARRGCSAAAVRSTPRPCLPRAL